MEILNSPWLIKMLGKSSKSPRGRLLSLFDILEDWLEAPNVAPNVAISINAQRINVQLKSSLANQAADKLLITYLSLEAAKAGAAMPEMLANQLYFMAIAAAQEKLHAKNLQSLVHATSLNHAKLAAAALISAQTNKEFHIAKPTAYALAASFAAIFAMTAGLLMLNLQQPTAAIASMQIPIRAATPQMVVAEAMAEPQQTAALMAQIEQMRHGNCQLIEAIQLPDSQKAIYLNMVVNGQVSTNPKEQAIAFELLRRTPCNYTPMLMAHSK